MNSIMYNSVQGFAEKIKRLIDKKTTVRIMVERTVASDDIADIDLTTLVPQGWTYDYKASISTVKVLDQNVSSPTNGYWVDGSAVVLIGCNVDGMLRVVNLYEETLSVVVYVNVVRNSEV